MNKKMLYVATSKCASHSIRSLLEQKYAGTNSYIECKIASFTGVNYEIDDPKTGRIHNLKELNDFDDIDIVRLRYYRPPIWDICSDDDGRNDRLLGQDSNPNDILFNDDWYKWAVVRNPWQKVAAAYELLVNKRNSGCYKQKLDMSFEDFVLSCVKPVPQVCIHKSPERFVKQGMDDTKWQQLLSQTDSTSLFQYNPCLNRVGSALRMTDYEQVQTHCDKAVLHCVQRWEDSVLFNSTTTATTLPADELSQVMNDHQWFRCMSTVQKCLYVTTMLDDPSSFFLWAFQQEIRCPRPLDKLVKFENLMEGIEEVCSDLGIETWDIPHKNDQKIADKARHYEKMFEGRQHLIDAVAQWYKYEIGTFDYEFGHYL